MPTSHNPVGDRPEQSEGRSPKQGFVFNETLRTGLCDRSYADVAQPGSALVLKTSPSWIPGSNPGVGVLTSFVRLARITRKSFATAKLSLETSVLRLFYFARSGQTSKSLASAFCDRHRCPATCTDAHFVRIWVGIVFA